MADPQRGSVLMLMPAAILVLVVLAAITVDAAVVYLAERELADAAAAAANDAAGAALDDARFYRQGEVVVDPRRAVSVAREAIDRRTAAEAVNAPLQMSDPDVVVDGSTVCVSLRGSVSLVFSGAIPGVRDRVDVSARATSTAAGDGTTAVPLRRIC